VFFQSPAAWINAVVSVPAPVGGLNARDSLAAMPPTDAVILQNWWPQPFGVSVRKGYREWATGMPSEVATLASWASSSGPQKFFAWSGPSVYDITNAGPVGVPLVTGLTNAIWDTINLVNSAGSHLIALNGVDDGILYNSLGGARIVAGDGIVPNTWDGIDPKVCVCPTVHQHRLWVVEKDTANGWFLPPDAIKGTFQKYDFGPLFSKGGFLQFLSTWTLDDGSGATDHLIAVSSRGEAVVYEGTDPEDDQAWRLTGVYFIGAPMAGRRAFCKAGGDQYVLTQQGVVSMSSVLTSTRVNQFEDRLVTNKIQFLISELTSAYSPLFGWDMKYFPKDNMLIMNVPSVTVGGNIQLAANQITNAWTEFLGIDSVCWNAFGSQQFFGDYSGRVLMFWTGTIDNVLLDGTGGKGIISSVMQAYSYLGNMATQKQVGMFRPTFIVNAPLTISASILYDFSTADLPTPTSPPKNYSALWDYGLWGQAIWGGGDSVQKQWIQAQGMGVAAALRMVTQTEAEVLWVATDYSTVQGKGIL
jgi:hypothetical protein